MPEYLAPGVYVEETSFRAKSIEGVSTSTSAFVGPTRRGPIGDTPELVTSFADFSRIYGGLGDLFGRPNYLAHAVNAYFNEGGRRLYVSRAYQASDPDDALSGVAVGDANIVSGSGDAGRARWVARFPGSAGNGRIAARLDALPATLQTMSQAPAGTLLRVGADSPATPARLTGGTAPFRVKDGSKLLLTVGGAQVSIDFKGKTAKVAGTAIFDTNNAADTIDIADGDETVEVTVNGGTKQAVELSAGTYTRDALVAELDAAIDGADVSVPTSGGDAGKLVFTTDRRGFGASLTVSANASLGLAGGSNATAQDNANTVPDLGAVTAGQINDLLAAGSIAVTASTQAGALVLSTTATGEDATLEVRTGTNSAHGELGLAAGSATGEAGPDLKYYTRVGTSWIDSDENTLSTSSEPVGGAEILLLTVFVADADGNQNAYEGLGFVPGHPRYAGSVLGVTPSSRADGLERIFALEVGSQVDPMDLFRGLFSGGDRAEFTLAGGADGSAPGIQAYTDALNCLQPLEDISIVAAPGHTAFTGWEGIQGAVISYVSRPRAYQIAVLDTPPARTVGEARKDRGRIDSTRAALYFPWITIANPLARPGLDSVAREVNVPPSGFLAGIYARTDVERGVFKAPANEVVRGAIRFESDVNTAQQDVLNPLGVNCLRFFPGRGYRVWGARTASSDPEWKYVNVRRYFNYLERSIDNGTQWAVFEPNGERLWANIRQTVEDFLYTEWRNGALLGSSPKEAFFVRCDRSTMTQNDLDNGRLICQVGVAVIKPAEYVIFQIGQKTADART